MERLFKAGLITAVVSFVLFYVVRAFFELFSDPSSLSRLVEMSDVVSFFLLMVVMVTAIVYFKDKCPSEASSVSGAVLGLIVYGVYKFVGVLGVRNIGLDTLFEMVVVLLPFVVVFFLAGYIGKWNSESKKSLYKQPWFIVVLLVFVLLLALYFAGLVYTSSYAGRVSSLDITEGYTCNDDDDCPNNYPDCINKVCSSLAYIDLSYDFDDGSIDEDHWYGDTEGEEYFWHIEEDGESVEIEGWGHAWLHSSFDLYELESVEMKVRVLDWGEEGTYNLNFLTLDEDIRYYLSFDEGSVGYYFEFGVEGIELLEEQMFEFESDNIYDVRVELRGEDFLEVYIDEEKVLTHSTSLGYQDAHVSLETLEGSVVRFDEIKIQGQKVFSSEDAVYEETRFSAFDE